MLVTWTDIKVLQLKVVSVSGLISTSGSSLFLFCLGCSDGFHFKLGAGLGWAVHGLLRLMHHVGLLGLWLHLLGPSRRLKSRIWFCLSIK
jgi:hypothetical protein